MKHTGIVALFFALLTVSISARGATLKFSDEGSFLASAGNVAVEHFETLEATDTSFTLIETPFFTMDPTFTADGLSVATDGVGATDGTDNWILMAPIGVGVPAGTVIIDLAISSKTFGFNVFDWGDLRTSLHSLI